MSGGFIHSVKVPRIYKTSASIVKRVTEDAASLKQLIYERKHPNVKGILALTAITLQHASQLEEIIRNTEILSKENRLDPWLTRVLISELIWGKQSLKSDAKPILTIQKYENILREELKKINQTSTDLFTDKKVKKPRFIRINTLVLNVDEAIQGFKDDGYIQLPRSTDYESYLKTLENLDTWEFIQDFHLPELIAFASGTKFYDHSGYQTGAILLQDKVSCLPAFLLNPTPGSVVLDTCAAPGMKTTHLAAIMKNEGKIYAIEKNDRRYQTLCQFVESTKADIVETIHENATLIDSTRCPDVEFILVDPSCSGSGMDRPEFDKNDKRCDPNRLKSLQSFQVFMLRHALSNFSKAKKVVYSTCSIYAEENEMVIDEVLASVRNSWYLVSLKKLFNGTWHNFSSKKFKCEDNCLYAQPDEDLTSGFFVAVFERNFDEPLPIFKKHKAILKTNQIRMDTNKRVDKQSKTKSGRQNNNGNEQNEVEISNETLQTDTNSTQKIKNKKTRHDKECEALELTAELDSLITTEHRENTDENQTKRKKLKLKRKRKHSATDDEDNRKQKSLEIEVISIETETTEVEQNVECQHDVSSKKKKKKSNEAK